MADFEFNIETRELVITDGDFTYKENPSSQNGGIILNSRCAINRNPVLGIGMEQIINGAEAITAFELNRWANQVKSDGGKASYDIVPDAKGINPVLTTKVNYL